MNAIQRRCGFTLIEVTVVIAIVAILATIAYPRYAPIRFRASRIEANLALLDMAICMEQYYTEHKTYHTITSPSVLGLSSVSVDGEYRFSIIATKSTYTLTATPISSAHQNKDIACSPLSLTHTHEKGPNSRCWE